MGLFGSHKNDPAFGDRIRAAIAMLQGDQNAAARFQQLQIERQRLAATQQQNQQEQDARNNQIWGAKELGYSVPEISVMAGGDLSQLQRARMEPYTLSAGAQRTTPGIGGSQAQTQTAPTTDQQTVDMLNRADPSGRLATSYLAKQAALTATGTDEQGRPTVTQIDPTVLFPGLNLNFGGQPQQGAPQTGAAPPPQLPVSPEPSAADTRPPGQEAPAFNANPVDLANAPPIASYRGVQFGPPLANMPRRMGQRARPRGIVNVASPEEAARLPRGTRFRTPDGRVIVRQ